MMKTNRILKKQITWKFIHILNNFVWIIDDLFPVDQDRNMCTVGVEPDIPGFHVLAMKQADNAWLEL